MPFIIRSYTKGAPFMLFIILLLLFYYVVYYFIFLELQPQDLFQMIEQRHKHETKISSFSIDSILYVVGFICAQVFWELRDNGIVKNL